MPAEERVVNTVAEKFGVQAPNHLFDTFDVVRAQWIEVKVTAKFLTAIDRYEEVREEAINSCLVWVCPSTGEIRKRGRTEPLPGEQKVTEFILNRAKYTLNRRGIAECSLFEEEDPIDEIFRCRRLNAARDEWVSTWWEDRNLVPLNVPAEFHPDLANKAFEYREMALWIEDTRNRSGEIMKLKPKVLPPVLLSPIKTSEENDEDLVTLFMNAIEPMQTSDFGRLVYSLKEDWLNNPQRSTFMFKIPERRSCKRRRFA